MKKIAFVIPWFGKLPNYFQLWLESCKRNPTIDFLVFTDQQPEYPIPENIKLFQYTFKEMVYRFEKKIGFPVALYSPYKLCDFKPSYGEVFEDYLNDYDYWGHCDVDLIWGDIRKFVTDELLEKYVRIFSRGHCTIYRNSSEVNAMYRLLPSNGKQNWKEVFQSPDSFCFDEWAGHCRGVFKYLDRKWN